MEITLRQLEIFYTVAKIGHVTNSSEILGISQSAISMAIQELEKSLKTKLFERIGRSLQLNENGRVLYSKAYKILEDVRAIEDEFLNKEISGHLIVGASQTIANYILPIIIYEFSKLNKEAQIELRIGNTDEIASQILSGAIDIGFVEGNVSNPAIATEHWRDDQLCIVTGGAVDTTREYDLKELLSKKWLMREKGSGTRRYFEEKVLKNRYTLNDYLEVGGFEAIKQILKNDGESFACVSRVSVADELASGVIRSIKVKGLDLKRDLWIIHFKNKFKSKLFKAFTDYAKSYPL
ncbi:MAG: LysR family transcriptional regulator [Campylobacterales bacterium]